MTIRRSALIVSALAAIALATIAITGFVAPAAQAATENCQLGYACVWPNTTYGGTGYGTANGSAMPDSIKNQGSSAAANGRTCRSTYFYDGSAVSTAPSHFELNSKYLTGGNYRDPMLSNGAGVGPGAGQNWDNRVSSAFFSNC